MTKVDCSKVNEFGAAKWQCGPMSKGIWSTMCVSDEIGLQGKVVAQSDLDIAVFDSKTTRYLP